MENRDKPLLYDINPQLTISIRKDRAPWAQPACLNAELYLIASLTQESSTEYPKSEDCSFINRGIQPVRDGKGMLTFSNIIMKQYGNKLGLCTTGPASGCFAYELKVPKRDIPLKWGYINNYLYWDYSESEHQIAKDYKKLCARGFLSGVYEDQFLKNPYSGLWIILRPLLYSPNVTIANDIPSQSAIGIQSQLEIFSQNELRNELLRALSLPMSNAKYLNFIERLLTVQNINYDVKKFKKNTAEFERQHIVKQLGI
jgi:hypothetical protein